jgi:predicted transglutaminase-like cysteine proteinase
MAENLTNTFWGLERRFPRFAEMPKATPLEGFALGSIYGLLFICIAYAVQLAAQDQIQQALPFGRDEYLIALAVLFGAPSFAGMLLACLLWFTHPKPSLSEEVSFRGVRAFLTVLREDHRLGVLDWLLILGLPLLALGEAFFLGVRFDACWREWPVGLAVLLTALSLRALRANPFVPVTRSIEIPPWVDDLLPPVEEDSKPSDDDPDRERRRFCRQNGVVDRDDCTDEQNYFRYTFHDSLPMEVREIGVQCSPDTVRQMALFLASNGGAFYQKDKYQGTVKMIDHLSGCLPGVGAIEMKRLAAQIMTRAKFARWTRYRLAEAILHFVQRAIVYAKDLETTGHKEYGRFPLQTLLDGRGDCECTSILCCALLSHTGFKSALVSGNAAGGSGHVMVALQPPADAPAVVVSEFTSSPGSWLYGETALDGGSLSWQPDYSANLETVELIVPIPPQAA